MPEKKPLMMTISVELLLLIILVQLFSKPKQMQAPSTKREPSLRAKASMPSKLRMMLAMVTMKIASHSFLEIISLKITRAMMEVA